MRVSGRPMHRRPLSDRRCHAVRLLYGGETIKAAAAAAFIPVAHARALAVKHGLLRRPGKRTGLAA